jgi:lipopolysaccharide biosynthesis regulator YciM
MENPDAFRGFLEQAIQRSDDVRLVLALADQLGAIRASPEAERVLLQRLQGSVTLSGLHRLLELRASDENSDVGQDEYGMLARLTGALAAQESGYECRCCGFRGKAMHWQCPGCRNWNTTLPRHPAPTLTHGDTFTK